MAATMLHQYSVPTTTGEARVTTFADPARAIVTLDSGHVTVSLHGFTAADLRALATVCDRAANALDAAVRVVKHIPACPTQDAA